MLEENMILSKKDLVKKNDGEYVRGVVFIRNYTKQPTRNGGVYLAGNLSCVGDMQFKVWSGNSCFDEMSNKDLQGKICLVSGNVNVYNGSYSLILNSCEVIDSGFSELDFYEEKYNVDKWYGHLVKDLKKNVSDEAFEIFNLIMSDKEVENCFLNEFAAVHHHDNCKSGLLAHTVKVVRIMTILQIYPEISNRVTPDVLFLGAALHDIGKIMEYDKGCVSPMGKRVSHLTWGIILLDTYRSKIIELKGEEFYYDLLSIISQHHGDYGERPRTLGALIVHFIDCLESNLSSLNQSLEGVEKDTQISYDGMKLM